MRALLVVNPKATTTSERGRDVLVRALRSEVSLTVAYTRRRGHAATLAAEATNDGVDIVIAVGGDGTVNEAVNGILRAKPSADAADRPALAVVPGGSTNVFARAMGLPKDWGDGTGVILEALRDGPDGPRCRTIATRPPARKRIAEPERPAVTAQKPALRSQHCDRPTHPTPANSFETALA